VALHAASGSLFVADAGNNRVRYVDLLSRNVSTLCGGTAPQGVDGTGSAAGFNAPWGVAMSANTSAGAPLLYVLEFGGSRLRAVHLAAATASPAPTATRSATPSPPAGAATPVYAAEQAPAVVTSTVAFGSRGALSGRIDGIGTAALMAPNGLTLTPGLVHFTDINCHCVRTLNITSQLVSTLAGRGCNGCGNTGRANGRGTTAQFSFPRALAATPAGDAIIVSDTGNNMIRSVDIASRAVAVVAGGGCVACVNAGFADGVAERALFNQQWGVAVDLSAAWVCDALNNVIRRVALSTAVVTTLAGGGGGIFRNATGYANGAGTNALFRAPRALLIDPTFSILYVGDSGNANVRRVVIATGVVSTLAGGLVGPNGGAPIFGYADLVGEYAGFNVPGAFAIAPDGKLLVVDIYNFVIRSIDVRSNATVTVAGNRLYSPTLFLDGVGTTSAFNLQYGAGMAADAAGNVFIADTGNSAIRMLNVASGAVVTVAGGGGGAGTRNGYSDGVGASALVSAQAFGLLVDNTGNVLIADGGGGTPNVACALRRFNVSSRAVATVVGGSLAQPP
jgi:hypothetical protein